MSANRAILTAAWLPPIDTPRDADELLDVPRSARRHRLLCLKPKATLRLLGEAQHRSKLTRSRAFDYQA